LIDENLIRSKLARIDFFVFSQSIGFGASLRDSPSRKQAEEATIAAPSTPSELPAPILNPLSSVEPIDLVKFGLIPEVTFILEQQMFFFFFFRAVLNS
jgi:ATP-dependent protease Clp ATPase subunit